MQELLLLGGVPILLELLPVQATPAPVLEIELPTPGRQ